MSSVRVVCAAALAALAAWSFRPVFDAEAGLAFAVAVVVPAAVVAAWELLATSVLKRMSGGVGTALALLWVVAAVAAVTRPGRDVLSGPFRLLTSVLPTEAAAPQLAAVSVLSGLTSLAAVHLAARAVLLPVLPASVCLALGLSLGAAAGPLPAWYVPAFVVVSTLPALFSAGTASRARLVVGGVVVALAAVVGPAFGLLGPTALRPPASAQALVDAPVQPKRHTNPMAQYLALRDGRMVLEIDGTASERVDRLGMVTLTGFDGRAWSPAADYRRAAHQLPAPSQGTAPRRETTLHLRLGTPDSIGWLPRPGWPGRVSVADLGFDADTGDLVVPAGQETPAEYRISATEPVVSPELLRTDQPAVGAGRPDLLLPPEVLGFVDAATAGQHTELDRFLGLYHNLRAVPFHYDASDEAPGGNGLYQVSALLKSHRGTSEQYASAFALMCRQLGWDARVVLGFRPRWDGDALHVEGRDVFAWVEVRFERLGWLPIDPSPTREAADVGDEPPDQATRPDTGSVQLPPAHDPEPAPEPEWEAPPNAAVPPTPGPRSDVVLPVAGAVSVALLFAVPLLKAARRRALRRGTPRRRVMAAWREAVTTLRAGGAPVHERQTTGQVVEAVPEIHRLALRPLAELVDRVGFAPDEVTEEMAATAARQLGEIRAQVRGGLSPGRRAAWLFDPRPLVVRRRPVEYEGLGGLRPN